MTALASWSSSNMSVAQVNDQVSKGLATSVAIGTATITATLNGINGAAQLTVDPAALVSIEILPSTNVQIAIAATRQLVAAGRFTDNSTQDITASMTWNSSNTNIAAISNVPDMKGLASGVTEGAVIIEATLNSFQSTKGLTVLPIRTIDYEIPHTKGAGIRGLGIDSSGNALAAWDYRTPRQFYSASYPPGGDWSTKMLADVGAIEEFPGLSTFAMNASGIAMLAGAGHSGIYVSKYTPGGGWQPARTITSGSTPFLTFAQSLNVAVDANGNGLLVWANDNGNKLLSSQYRQDTDTWSAPQELPNVDLGFALGFVFAMNASGYAVIIWQNWTFNVTPGWTLYASVFVPGTGQGTGWQPPQSLHQSRSNQMPAAAINDAGEIVAVWIDVSISPNLPTSLYAKRFIPNQGWQSLEEIVLNDISRPASPKVAMNNAGSAIVVWRNSFDFAVRSSRFVVGSGWQTPETHYQPSPFVASNPEVLQPHISSEGRILAAWVTHDLNAPFKVGLRRYVPASGWENAYGLPYLEHKAQLGGLLIAFNQSGAGVVFWTEAYLVFDGQFSNTVTDFYVNAHISY